MTLRSRQSDRAKRLRALAPVLAIALTLAISASAGGPAPIESRSVVADRVMKLTRHSSWRLVSSVPIAFRTLWTANGLDMTHNPVWIEATHTGLRAYFMPEDDSSVLYIYEVDTK